MKSIKESWRAEASLLPLKDQQIVCKIVFLAITEDRKELMEKVSNSKNQITVVGSENGGETFEVKVIPVSQVLEILK